MSNIVVSLVTYYPQESIRRKLALKTIEELILKGFTVVVVDGGSDKPFLNKIINLGVNVYTQEKPNLREAKRQAYQRAYDINKRIIVCMEPEKFDFVKSISTLANYLIEHSIDFLIPGRNNFSSCSQFQAASENLLNLFYQEYTSLDMDFCFGPLLWKREHSHYLIDFEPKIEKANWDIQIIPPLQAKKDGKTVKQINVDFTYPAEMMQEEEKSIIFNQKRINQLNSLTQTIQLYPELRFN